MAFNCSTCGYKSEDVSNFRRHNKSKGHLKKVAGDDSFAVPEKKQFKCDCCNYVTFISSNFSKHLVTPRHLKISTGKSTTKTYLCPICQYSTKASSNYYKHIKIHQKNPIVEVAKNNSIISRCRRYVNDNAEIEPKDRDKIDGKLIITDEDKINILVQANKLLLDIFRGKNINEVLNCTLINTNKDKDIKDIGDSSDVEDDFVNKKNVIKCPFDIIKFEQVPSITFSKFLDYQNTNKDTDFLDPSVTDIKISKVIKMINYFFGWLSFYKFDPSDEFEYSWISICDTDAIHELYGRIHQFLTDDDTLIYLNRKNVEKKDSGEPYFDGEIKF